MGPRDCGSEQDAPTPREALLAAVKDHYARIRHSFARLLDSHTADDLAQEVFQRVFVALVAERRIGEMAPFIQGTARHVLMEYLRKRKRRGTVTSHLGELPDTRGEPGDITESRETESIIRRLLRQLDPEEQTLLIGRYYLNLRGQELADLLGVPRTTLLDRHNRAIRKLRKLAREHGISSGDYHGTH